MACSQDVKEKKTASKETSDIVNRLVGGEEFKTLLKGENVQVIDVRTKNEFDAGHIDNALNIDFYGENFKTEMLTLDKNNPVLIYCHSGGRSGKAASMLKELKFKEVYDLKGGYSNWK